MTEAAESQQLPTITREEYLTKAVEKLRPLFAKNKLEIGPVKVSCGWTFKNPRKHLGECWSATCSSDNITRQIFITPNQNAVTTIGTLAHELLHASLPDSAKHGPKFKEGMKLIGLEGKAISASPGPELLTTIEKIAEELGAYPNPTLKPKEKTKLEKATSKKSFKLHCPQFRNADKSCRLIEIAKAGDYTVNVTRKSLKLGFPLCPGCSKEMEMEPEDFELYKLGAD